MDPFLKGQIVGQTPKKKHDSGHGPIFISGQKETLGSQIRDMCTFEFWSELIFR